MEEVKIWAIHDGSDAIALPTQSKVETEKLLEDTLVNKPDILLPELRLVGRQTPTEGGPLDLLGVDGDGRLVVFELKRGILSREAIAQIIDYASSLDAMGSDALARHISNRSGEHGIEEIEDFQTWYSALGFDEMDDLLPPRLFLVGLGADDTTQRMVDFLAKNSGLDISLLSFYGFDYEGKTLLAKQVEISGNPDPPQDKKRSREEKWADLDDKANGFSIGDLYRDVKAMFEKGWRPTRQRPGRLYFSVKLRRNADRDKKPINYAEVFPEQGRIRINFLRRAFELCENEFEQASKLIAHETSPRGKGVMDPDTEKIEFLLTPDDWEKYREKMVQLTDTVYDTWRNSGSKDESNQD